jgi:hypothetical protein
MKSGSPVSASICAEGVGGAAGEIAGDCNRGIAARLAALAGFERLTDL